MFDIEITRQMVALSMLLVASLFDIKKREVNDIVWIIFGGIGITLYLFEPVTYTTILYLGIGVVIGIVWMLAKAFGQADGLALIALAITLPVHDRLPVTVMVSIVVPFLAALYGLCSNISYNISDLLHGRLFFGVCEKPHRKAFAFLVLHRKRMHERFVFPAQVGNKFVFHFRPKTDLEFSNDFQGHVVSALPLIPFMLASVILILLL
ncbi:MAG: prepilin peptidase [Thaumarchaeota archaeon]|nr:prepilin peptidase [Nitrososphaerota archaeon]